MESRGRVARLTGNNAVCNDFGLVNQNLINKALEDGIRRHNCVFIAGLVFLLSSALPFKTVTASQLTISEDSAPDRAGSLLASVKSAELTNNKCCRKRVRTSDCPFPSSVQSHCGVRSSSSLVSNLLGSFYFIRSATRVAFG